MMNSSELKAITEQTHRAVARCNATSAILSILAEAEKTDVRIEIVTVNGVPDIAVRDAATQRLILSIAFKPSGEPLIEGRDE